MREINFSWLEYFDCQTTYRVKIRIEPILSPVRLRGGNMNNDIEDCQT